MDDIKKLIRKASKNNNSISIDEILSLDLNDEEFEDVLLYLKSEGIDIQNESPEDLSLISFESNIVKDYLKEIGEIPILTPEEEKEIAIRASSGNKWAKNKLIEHNLKLVVSVAKKYSGNKKYEIMDIIQEGNI